MKIVVAQQSYQVGNFAYNIEKIGEAIRTAKEANADLIVFPELAICGTPAKDLLFSQEFIEENVRAVHTIKELADGIGILIGTPWPADNLEKSIYNAALLLEHKEVSAIAAKTHLSSKNISDEHRYFIKSSFSSFVSFLGKKLFVTLSDDLWCHESAFRDKIHSEKPDLIIHLAAAPFDYVNCDERKNRLIEIARNTQLPLAYCNSAGAQASLIFEGSSCILDHKGTTLASLPAFEEGIIEIDLRNSKPKDEERMTAVKSDYADLHPERNIDLIYTALLQGIKEYFRLNGFKQAVIGSSGGLDSAVTIALAAAALGGDNVLSVLMPSEFSTSHSITDAKNLSENLKSPYEIIPVKSIYTEYIQALQPLFKNLPFNVAEENLQARSRGVLLMGISNKFGHLLLNTSNKSELAMGYGTLYGDLAGGISVLGDCYKLQVYALARYINRNKEIIPTHIITKPPSAELRPDQKDTDSLPPYEVLDQLLYKHIERGFSRNELLEAGFNSSLVNRVLRNVQLNEYKRHQFCPILKISPQAFGEDRMLPIQSFFKSL